MVIGIHMKISQEKFFPSNPKWSEEYIHYLGSIIKDSYQYDLGIWVAPGCKDVSWLFVQSEELGGYQSGSIVHNNTFNYQLLKSKYNDGSGLPVIETVIQAQLQNYFKKFHIRDLNFRGKYIFDTDINTFLIHPYKFKNITIYLKRNLTKLTDVIIIEADNHWNNTFFHKGNYYTYKDVLLVEDN